MTQETKSETENSEEYENFTRFVKQVLKVPKSEIDESIRKERAKEKEEHQDPLEKKRQSK